MTMNDSVTGNHLGAMLAKARAAHGWSLRGAAKATGVPNAHISQIETGAIRQPSQATLVKLAAGYSLPLGEVMNAAGYLDLEKHRRGTVTDWRCGNCGAVHYDLPPTQRCSFCGWRALDGENGLFEATIILCARCLSGAGGECHQPGCALWMSRAPDVALWNSPMVMFRPAPQGETTVIHYTPEEHDQPECDADLKAVPGETMWGTLNRTRVTCPACKALIEAQGA